MSNFSLPLDFFRLTRIWKWMSIWFHYILGRTHNKLNILKAFLIGLLRQRTHQELANEKKLHLVEMRAEMGNFPVVSILYLDFKGALISESVFILANPPPKKCTKSLSLNFSIFRLFRDSNFKHFFVDGMKVKSLTNMFLPLGSLKIILNSYFLASVLEDNFHKVSFVYENSTWRYCCVEK